MITWKVIPGYEDYEASEYGIIRRIATKDELYQCNDEGYLSVNMNINGKCISRTVHQLTALAFIPQETGKSQVNHIDRIKTNNKVDNLEWCTTQENTEHFWSQYGTEPIEDHVYIIKNDEVKLVTSKESKEMRKLGWKYGNGIYETPWVTKGRCYVHNEKEERMIQFENLTKYLEDGWKKGRLIRRLKAIQKDGVQKFVSENEIRDYELKGWTQGSIKSGWIHIIKDDEIKLINPDLLNKYVEQGWERMGIQDNKVNVHKDTITKTIDYSELQEYLLFGWKYGSYRCGLKGRKWINNGKEDKCISEYEMDEYISKGWKQGRVTSGTLNRKSMVKDGIQKFVPENEIPQKLADGWKLESLSSGNRRKIWIYRGKEELQINRDDFQNYEKDGWKEGRPKNKIFIYNDSLKKCIKISIEDSAEYFKLGWRPGRR